MIFKLLDSIRKKPRHVRSLIALGVSFGFTLVVIVAWYFSYSAYLKEVMFESRNKDVPGDEETVQPLDALKNSVTDGWGNMKSQISDVNFISGETGTTSQADFTSSTEGSAGEAADESGFQSNTETEVRPNNSSASTGSQAENLIE